MVGLLTIIIKATVFKHTFDVSVKSSHNGSTWNRMGYNTAYQEGTESQAGVNHTLIGKVAMHILWGKKTKLQTKKLLSIDKQIDEAKDGSAQSCHGAEGGGSSSWRGSRARSGSQRHQGSSRHWELPWAWAEPGHGPTGGTHQCQAVGTWRPPCCGITGGSFPGSWHGVPDCEILGEPSRVAGTFKPITKTN